MKLSFLMKDLEPMGKNEMHAGTEAMEIKGIAFDSRRVKPGYVFVALPGETSDGHDFLDQAEKLGACAAVVSRDVASGLPLWKTQTPRRTLADLAARYFGEPSLKMRVAGVTGTNGKTSVTFLVEAMLKAAGRNPGVLGTIHYRFNGREIPAPHTTPESVDLQDLLAQMLRAGVTDVVMEVSSHAIAQERVHGIHFDVAGFTNLTQDHLDFHKTLESYFETKKRFFSELLPESRKKQKTIVANLGDPKGQELVSLSGNETRSFGVGEDVGADVRVSNAVFNASGISADLSYAGNTIAVSSPLIGRHNLENILVASGMALGMGVSLVDIAQGLKNMTHVPGRLERVANGRNLHIFVDYAHTPDGLKHVAQTLKSLASASGGRLITVFGCGGDRDRSKRPLMAFEAAAFSDVIVVTSDNPRTEAAEKIIDDIFEGFLNFPKDNLHRVVQREEALQKAVSLCRPGDFLLVAGKGHEDYQIIGTTKHPFRDADVLRRFL